MGLIFYFMDIYMILTCFNKIVTLQCALFL